MPEPDLAGFATALLTRTPGWARAGLTAPSKRTREAAAAALAQTIVAALDRPAAPVDSRQLALPL